MPHTAPRHLRWLGTFVLCLLALTATAQTVPTNIRTGADRLAAKPNSDTTLRYAVVANQTSVVGNRHLVDTLRTLGYHIATIFCPEHGFRGTAAAGAHVADSVDPETGIPIVSLYGKNKKPTPKQLDGIDVVIFDLQDVGCRFYTYISTLHYVMEAVAEQGINMMVLDRPNPNGHYVDGPVLEPKYRSFVGMHPVPIVYGMTIGEYALMINGERWLTDSLVCKLEVQPLEGYTHDSACCRSLVLPVAPSPNLRTPQAIALYPSLCLFEGTNVSLGRGTPHPFEVIGKGNLTMDLRQAEVPSRFDLTYLREMYRRTPSKANFFLKSNFFEKLAGNGHLRRQLQEGADEASIRASWQPRLSHFKTIRNKYLLYP